MELDFLPNEIINEGCVKLSIEAAEGNLEKVVEKYPRSFLNEMARQLTGEIESSLGIEGLADSTVELVMSFSRDTYLEHISENITYRRLSLIDSVSAPRDFWVKWTRLAGEITEYNEGNILFEIGEDVEQKIREREYRYLLSSGNEKYHSSMSRKKVIEWREVIRRAVKRGELTKLESDFELAPETLELEERIADLLGKRTARNDEAEKPEIPYIHSDESAFEAAMARMRLVVEENDRAEEDELVEEDELMEEVELLEEVEEPETEEELEIEEEIDEEDEDDLPWEEDEDTVEEILTPPEAEDDEIEFEEDLEIEEEIEEVPELEIETEEDLEEEIDEEIEIEIEIVEEPEEEIDEEIEDTEEEVPEEREIEIEIVEEPSTEDEVVEEPVIEEPVIAEPAPVAIPTPIADRAADIRQEIETKIRLEYEIRAREKAEQTIVALRREIEADRKAFDAEREALQDALAEANAEAERLRTEYQRLVDDVERAEAHRLADEAQRLAEEQQLRQQIETQLRAEAKERERLAEAARMAIEAQQRLEAEAARAARQREEEERIEAERRRQEEAERELEAIRQAELERIRREEEEAKARAKAAMPEMGDGRYSYTSKSVKLIFRRSVDPNITTRIHEIIKATVEYYGKDKVYLKIRATVEDTQTVVLDFIDVPIEEMELLGNIIKILGNSGLGIAKAIIE